MLRAPRLSTSMGYIAAIFHKANEYPRVEPPSFGCAIRGAYRPFARSGFRALARCRSPRLRAAALASPSHGADRTAIFITLRAPPPRVFSHRANAAPEAEQHSLGSMA